MFIRFFVVIITLGFVLMAGMLIQYNIIAYNMATKVEPEHTVEVSTIEQDCFRELTDANLTIKNLTEQLCQANPWADGCINN